MISSTGAYSIVQMAATGTGRPEMLLEGPALNTLEVTDWTRDGKLIVFNSRSEKTRDDLFLLSLEGDRKARVFLQTPAVEVDGRFSPDSQWLAYMSDEAGGFEIYVWHVPDNGSKYQISAAGGVGPQWSRDGKELFYVQGRQTLMSVPVTLGETFERGPARQLFDDVPLGFFQPSADGQRFLVVLEDERSAQQALITVVTNWPATLKK
jgi:Tol biopolymer transport system component